jgi:hypothetical protein
MGGYIFVGVVSFLLGALCMRFGMLHTQELENLTQDEYFEAREAILTQFGADSAKVTALVAELDGYKNDALAEVCKLTSEMQQILSKVVQPKK